MAKRGSEDHDQPDFSKPGGKTAVAIEHGPVQGDNKLNNGSSLKKSEALDSEDPSGEKLKYPWYIVFILGNEFCERFSYYGMKTVLTLYFVEQLRWSPGTTTLVYHLFSVLCYFTPVFGAMLADGWLGKFNTIFSLSIVYVAGLVLLTVSAIPTLGLNVIAGTASGLLLIGFGTGGIKPVVPAYGGDQFRPGQEKQREMFFSIFYFCINAGSLISTFVTPILRSDVPCFGNEGCYPLAFGLPAGLLAVAVFAFVAGRPFYRNLPSKQNVIAQVFGVCGHALSNKFRKRGPVGAKHWLDNAADTYPKEFIKDVKQLLPVLKMFLPLPMFWALFDQQGSRWTLQATKMDGRVTDTYTWKPDQVQIFNPVLILLLIPIFEGAVFPLLAKCGIPFKALSRMTVGMVLAGVAFIIAGVVEMELEKGMPQALAANTSELRIYNSFDCNLNMSISGSVPFDIANTPDTFPMGFSLKPFENGNILNLPAINSTQVLQFQVYVEGNCSKISDTDREIFGSITTEVNKIHSLIIAENEGRLVYRQLILDKKEKPAEGRVQAQFILPFKFDTDSGGGDLILVNVDLAATSKNYITRIPLDRTAAIFVNHTTIVASNITAGVMDQGRYEVYYPDRTTPEGMRRVGSEYLVLANGGVFTVLLKDNKANSNNNGTSFWAIHSIVEASSLSVFLQLPQYAVMTIGEVLFSVSGLSFAYSQAPTSMKSVLQAGWLMTVAFGNVIVMIISGAQLIENQATEFFVFAGLIFAFAILFAIMVKYYKYVDVTPPATDAADKITTKKAKDAETDSL